MLRKLKAPTGLTFRFQIYSPSGAHKGFRVIKQCKLSRKNETIQHSEIDKINKGFINQIYSKDEARERIEALIAEFYAAEGAPVKEIVVSETNREILNAYWDYYSRKNLKNLQDPQAVRYELERAIEALGLVSLESGTAEELEAAIASDLDESGQSRVINKINSMLRFLERDIQLKHPEKDRQLVHYITSDDLPYLLKNLPTWEVRVLHQVCFYTGVTLGEVFALDPRSFTKSTNSIQVMEQVDNKGAKKRTRVKSRTAIVLPAGIEVLQNWFQIQHKFPQEVRRRVSRYTKKAAFDAFPDEPSKHITFQDLRHSYAIHLLNEGVTLELVAEVLGISHKFARDLYEPFVSGSGSIELINKILKKEKPKLVYDAEEKPILKIKAFDFAPKVEILKSKVTRDEDDE